MYIFTSCIQNDLIKMLGDLLGNIQYLDDGVESAFYEDIRCTKRPFYWTAWDDG